MPSRAAGSRALLPPPNLRASRLVRATSRASTNISNRAMARANRPAPTSRPAGATIAIRPQPCDERERRERAAGRGRDHDQETPAPGAARGTGSRGPGDRGRTRLGPRELLPAAFSALAASAAPPRPSRRERTARRRRSGGIASRIRTGSIPSDSGDREPDRRPAGHRVRAARRRRRRPRWRRPAEAATPAAAGVAVILGIGSAGVPQPPPGVHDVDDVGQDVRRAEAEQGVLLGRVGVADREARTRGRRTTLASAP